MPQLPCPHGRQQTIALASMNLRAVLAPHELRYLALPAPRRAVPIAAGTVRARFQPRDEAGRFVTYNDLRAAIGFECFLTDSDYALEDSSVVYNMDGDDDYVQGHDVDDPPGFV